MEAHEKLLEWATEQGITLNGIEPQRMPGRGFGLVATQAIKEDQVILEVPTSCLRTVDTVPKAVARRLPKDINVHALLAADLALDRTARFAVWNAVVPTRDDVWASMPLTWHRALQAHLPGPARKLLAAQQAKLARDWQVVWEAFGAKQSKENGHGGKDNSGEDHDTVALAEDDYMYAWLLVNTRTFYHTTPRTEKKLRKADHMALQPVADLFNHADAGCNVAFTPDRFSVRADRAYRRGEEVVISYGAHPNDALLVEYGFVLDSARNRWDEAGIDDAVLPALTRRQRALLEEAGFLGGYVLDRTTVCYRTQVALRCVCLSTERWRRYVDGGGDGDGDEDQERREQEKVDGLLAKLLRRYVEDTVDREIDEVEALGVGQKGQREMLAERWRQIKGLVEETVERLGG